MLDAYIIDEIKRERERQQERVRETGIPLYIDIEPPPMLPRMEESPDEKDRGVLIFDF